MRSPSIRSDDRSATDARVVATLAREQYQHQQHQQQQNHHKLNKMLFIITVALLLVSAQAKFYSDCGSQLATIEKVGVSGCSETAKECILKRNTNATISLQFTPSKDVKSVETVVHGVIMNLPVPFPLPQPDACKDTGLTCPLKAGKSVSYTATLPVLKSYPKVTVDVKWELKDQDDEDIICILIPAKIN